MTTRPLCRYCGKPIAKRTTVVFVRDPGSNLADSVQGPLYTKAECQRMVNQHVLSVSYGPHRHGGEGDKQVWSFNVWDGESFNDRYFCTGTCATRFAYLMVEGGHCTVAYNEAMRRQREERTR